jgi:hypothetical protein
MSSRGPTFQTTRQKQLSRPELTQVQNAFGVPPALSGEYENNRSHFPQRGLRKAWS